MELPPLTDVPPPKYLPIDKRGVVAARPDTDAAVPADAALFAFDVTRTEPARAALIAELGFAAAALDALEYVPFPPNERTDAAPYADGIAAVHNTQTIDSVDIFSSFLIKSLYLLNNITI